MPYRLTGFHAYAGEEIPDTEDALRVGLYMVRGSAATSRLRVDPDQEPKVRYLAKGTVPDHREEWTSSGHRDYNDFSPVPFPDYGPQEDDRESDFSPPPLPSRRSTCAGVPGCTPSHRAYTDGKRLPDAAAGGAAG